MSREYSTAKQSSSYINQQSNDALNELSVSIGEEAYRQANKPHPNFLSQVPREFLESVSKEIRQNPGPGSYLHDQLLKDKMRALSF